MTFWEWLTTKQYGGIDEVAQFFVWVVIFVCVGSLAIIGWMLLEMP